MSDIEDLMQSYREAYEAANGRALDGIKYNNGWFAITNNSMGRNVRYRRKQIEAFRDKLLQRAKTAISAPNKTD